MITWAILVTLFKVIVVVTSTGESIPYYDPLISHENKDNNHVSTLSSIQKVNYTKTSHVHSGAIHADYNDPGNPSLHRVVDTETPQFYSGTLNKCRCEGGQAWDGSSCLNTPTTVAVYEPALNQTFIVDSERFNHLSVGETHCPPNYLLVTLDSSRNLDHQFSLLPSGHLYWYQREYDLYCIDHMKPGSGDEMWWEAHVCLPPPPLPRCCPPGGALTDDFWCNGYSSQVLAPPIIVEGLEVTWPGETHTQAHQLNCSYTTLSLGSSEGYLKYSPDTVSLVWSPPLSQWKEQETDFCVGVQEGTERYQVRVCEENVLNNHQRQCNQSTCVRKCCPEHEIMHIAKCGAAESNKLWTPLFYDLQDMSSVAPAPVDITIIPGYPLCRDFFKLEPHIYSGDKFSLLSNGYLYVSSFQEYYPPTHYCIDNFYDDYDNVVYTQALACFQENVAEIACGATKKYVYPILLLVSSGFLGATLVIYASVPDLRNKLNGKCLISQVSALLVGYISLSVASLATGHMPPVLCKITASVIHLAVLAGFFWLNVMCFDIWRTLRKMRTVSGSAEWVRRRFMWYSLYSWGCPLLITIVAIIIEELPDSHNLIRPDFGTDFCWFQSRRSLWVYLYMYILALVLANIVFFIMVTVILCRSQNNPNLKRSREVNRERLWLCGKLFLVMGVTWLAEVLSWQEGNCRAWMVTDVINALQGLSIFLVFVCSRTTLQKVREMWPRLCCRRDGLRGNLSPSTTYTYTASSRDSRGSYIKDSPRLKRQSDTSARSSMGLQPLKEVDEQGHLHSGPDLHTSATCTAERTRHGGNRGGKHTAAEGTALV